MLRIEKKLTNKLSYPLEDDAFFLSIETTGLQADVSAITMIGTACLSDSGILLSRQYFNENGFEQKELLQAFLQEIQKKKQVITYYGSHFSLPFLDKKCEEFGLSNPLSGMKSLDYYELIRPFQKILGLTSCRQASIETYYGFKRTQNLSGKKLVKTYQDYIKQPSHLIKDKLLLHNEETIRILVRLYSMMAYEDFRNGNFTDCELSSIDGSIASFWFSLPFPLIHPIKCTYEFASLYADGTDCVIELPLDKEQCVKHFYPNPKDYYYFTVEDRAIHKSLASYVPKEFRKKATLSTCYEKIPITHTVFEKKETLQQFLCDTIIRILAER